MRTVWNWSVYCFTGSSNLHKNEKKSYHGLYYTRAYDIVKNYEALSKNEHIVVFELKMALFAFYEIVTSSLRWSTLWCSTKQTSPGNKPCVWSSRHSTRWSQHRHHNVARPLKDRQQHCTKDKRSNGKLYWCMPENWQEPLKQCTNNQNLRTPFSLALLFFKLWYLLTTWPVHSI